MTLWFEHDYFSNLFTINPKILNSQKYWNHFQYFKEENIEEIE